MLAVSDEEDDVPLSVRHRLAVLAHATLALLLVVATTIALDLLGLLDLGRGSQGAACACLASFICVGVAARRRDELRREGS